MGKVVVVGLGYVGLPLAIRAAEVGHEVVGLDVDSRKLTALHSGTSYVEDVSDDRVKTAVELGSFRPVLTGDGAVSSDEGAIGNFDVGVITVPTPLRHGTPDLSYVESAARLLGRWLTPGAVIVLESTTYPGTTEGLVADVLYQESGLQPERDYDLGFSPERIDPGNTTYTFENTPKVVSGTNQAALTRICAFYNGLVAHTVPVSSPRVAELTKLIENIFIQVNIALVNELAVLAHELGIDVWEALDAAETKPHGFMKFTPGPGVGGHCIPLDPIYFSWLARTRLDMRFHLSEVADDINSLMPRYVVERASEILNGRGQCLNESKVLIIGVAYKPGAGDTRESPALKIIELLEGRGARVAVADPLVTDWTATPRVSPDSVVAEAAGYSLLLLVTDHEEFDYEGLGRAAQVVLDCRHRMPAGANVWYL